MYNYNNMDFPIDTALSFIYVIYKSLETYKTNESELGRLVEKIQEFEQPLLRLKSAVALDKSIENHIIKLRDLLGDIIRYIGDYQRRGKISRFIGAIFIDDRIREFDDRIEAIKRDMNFELDLSNHIIFHSFHSIGQDLSRHFEDTLCELRTSKFDHVLIVLRSYLQGEVTTLRLELQESMMRRLDAILGRAERDGGEKAPDAVQGRLDEADAEITGDIDISQVLKRESERLVSEKKEKTDFYKTLLKYIDLSQEYRDIVVLKRHFDMISMLLLLHHFKGHYFFDGNTIGKRESITCMNGLICVVPIRVPGVKKNFIVNVSEENAEFFLEDCGFGKLAALKEYGGRKSILEFDLFYQEKLSGVSGNLRSRRWRVVDV